MNAIFDTEFTALLDEVVTDITLPTGAAGWGSDISCTEDVDEDFTELDGNDPLVVAQYTYRRLITNPGELADEPDWGCGLPRMLSKGYTTRELKTIQDSLRGEIARDDRLQNVNVATSYDFATEALTITVDAEIVDSDNVFSFTTASMDGATNLIEMLVNGNAANETASAIA